METTNIHILVVDDDQNLRELLTETLKAIGYLTTSAVDGQEALEKLQADQYDLVITDVKMPVMDGISLLRNIKRLQPNLPVLFITGVTEPVAIGHGSPDGFLAKPFRISHVEKLIEDALSGKTEVVGQNIRRVLIVDDDDLFRTVLSDIISRSGYIPITVKSGQEAMLSIANENIDAVITDIRMPEMNGLTLLSLIKEIRPDLPVILITGYDSIKLSEGDSIPTADGFLKKPFEMQAIVDLLNQLGSGSNNTSNN